MRNQLTPHKHVSLEQLAIKGAGSAKLRKLHIRNAQGSHALSVLRIAALEASWLDTKMLVHDT